MTFQRLLCKYWLVFFLVVVLILGGCSNHSIFTGLDYPDTEKISRYTGEKLLCALEETQDSQAFYRHLTVTQRERILSTLNSMISQERARLEQGELSLALPQSANAAVELIIHTDPIVYDIIYNFADPALSALSLSGISMDELYDVYTQSIKNFLVHGIENALLEVAQAFYNLYRISVYYQDAVNSARYGVYSGSDLQTYLLAGILGGLIEGTRSAVQSATLDYSSIAQKLSTAYYQFINSGIVDDDIVDQLFSALAKDLNITLESIINAYELELDFVAGIFESMAENAGYNLMAQDTAQTIRSWGDGRQLG